MLSDLQQYDIDHNIIIDVIDWSKSMENDCICKPFYESHNYSQDKIYKAIYFVEFNTNITIIHDYVYKN